MDQFSVPLIVVLLAVMVSTATDLWRFKIHNAITFPLLVSGVAYHGCTAGMTGLGESLASALFGFGVLIVFFAMGGVGAGDVKLLAGIGAWLGVPLTFLVFIASALACGLYALVVIIACGRVRETWINFQILWYRLAAVGKHLGAEEHVETEVGRADRRTRVIPYAAMVALGLMSLIVLALFVRTR